MHMGQIRLLVFARNDIYAAVTDVSWAALRLTVPAPEGGGAGGLCGALRSAARSAASCHATPGVKAACPVVR